MRGKLVREVEVELGTIWSSRGWPATPAKYQLEITEHGVRIRHERGPWFAIGWHDVMLYAVPEER